MAEFLADPNEDQEAADFFMAKFRKEGIRPGAPLNLVVRVTKVPRHKLSAVETQLRALYDCARMERAEAGALNKTAQLTAFLNPVAFERSNLLKAARAMYRLILDNEVKVEILAGDEWSRVDQGMWSRESLRKGLAILCAIYGIALWGLPAVIIAIFGELPYLHERDFLARLPFSAAGTVIVVLASAVLHPDPLGILRAPTRWETIKRRTLCVLGLAMFTGMAALWCGTLLGAIVKLTPGSEYSARFAVVGLGSSQRRSVSLSLKPTEGARDSYLTLSNRLFDTPRIRIGDQVVLTGKENIAGVYVESVRLLRPGDSFPMR